MKEKLRTGVNHGFATIAVMFGTAFLLSLFGVSIPKTNLSEKLIFSWITMLLIAPLLEEFVQRFIPLFPLRWKNGSYFFIAVSLILTASALLIFYFGYTATNYYIKLGAWAVLVSTTSMWIIRFFGKYKLVIWGVVIINSALFGLGHGNLSNVFVQGPAGIIFSSAYLRGGYISSVVAHMITNLPAAILILFVNL